MAYVFMQFSDEKVSLISKACKNSIHLFLSDETPSEEPQDQYQDKRQNDLGHQQEDNHKRCNKFIYHMSRSQWIEWMRWAKPRQEKSSIFCARHNPCVMS
jgi:hypothetical protein